MPSGIAGQRIASQSIGATGIAASGAGLPASPVAQMLDVITGSGTFTASVPGVLSIYLWGGAGSGMTSSGGGQTGGGGGGAAFKRLAVIKGQQIPWSCGAGGAGAGGTSGGNPGGDTTATLPNGVVLTATGGQGGGVATGGTGLNGDASGTGGAGANGGAGATGSNGGHAGSAGGAGSGGGGGAGGLDSVTPGLSFPASVTISQVVATGSPGNSLGGSSTDAGAGRVLMILQNYAAAP